MPMVVCIMNGQKINGYSDQAVSKSIDLSHLSDGLYFIRVHTETEVVTKKIHRIR